MTTSRPPREDHDEPIRPPDGANVREFYESGALHVVNETHLWPLGFALILVAEHDKDDVLVFDRAYLRLAKQDEAIGTGLTDEEHKALHATYDAWRERRLREVKP